MSKLSASLALSLVLCIKLASCQIAWNQQFIGDFTYFTDAGYGACGWIINGADENLTAISYEWFTTSNPNNDPYCTNNVCVNVTYGENSITVPVGDKCSGNDKYHLDLSQPAFSQLANLSVGHVYGAVWEFVPC